MEKSKIRIDIYESDPFGRICCGPGPRLASPAIVEELRGRLEERSEIVRKLLEKYKDNITLRRYTISNKRSDYPEYVTRLMLDETPSPYVFINKELAVTGKFPSYEEFVELLDALLK
jgi:hypothetical protein